MNEHRYYENAWEGCFEVVQVCLWQRVSLFSVLLGFFLFFQNFGVWSSQSPQWEDSVRREFITFTSFFPYLALDWSFSAAFTQKLLAIAQARWCQLWQVRIAFKPNENEKLVERGADWSAPLPSNPEAAGLKAKKRDFWSQLWHVKSLEVITPILTTS